MAESKKPAPKKKVKLRDVPKNDNRWAQVVARAWSDEAFKKRLLAEPAAVLKEAGFAMAEGVKFKVIENTERLVHLILPRRPATADLDAEELMSVRGGYCDCGPSCGFPPTCGSQGYCTIS